MPRAVLLDHSLHSLAACLVICRHVDRLANDVDVKKLELHANPCRTAQRFGQLSECIDKSGHRPKRLIRVFVGRYFAGHFRVEDADGSVLENDAQLLWAERTALECFGDDLFDLGTRIAWAASSKRLNAFGQRCQLPLDAFGDRLAVSPVCERIEAGFQFGQFLSNVGRHDRRHVVHHGGRSRGLVFRRITARPNTARSRLGGGCGVSLAPYSQCGNDHQHCKQSEGQHLKHL